MAMLGEPTYFPDDAGTWLTTTPGTWEKSAVSARAISGPRHTSRMIRRTRRRMGGYDGRSATKRKRHPTNRRFANLQTGPRRRPAVRSAKLQAVAGDARSS